MPGIDTRSFYEARKYYFMENTTYQVIFGLLNISMLFYANHRLNHANNIQRPQDPQRRIQIEGINDRIEFGRDNHQLYMHPPQQQTIENTEPSAPPHPQSHIPIAVAISNLEQQNIQTDYSAIQTAYNTEI